MVQRNSKAGKGNETEIECVTRKLVKGTNETEIECVSVVVKGTNETKIECVSVVEGGRGRCLRDKVSTTK